MNKAVIRDYRKDPENPRTMIIAMIDTTSLTVVLDGDPSLVEHLTINGIVGIEGGIKYYPKDGMEFLKRLPEYYTNGYIRAEIIE